MRFLLVRSDRIESGLVRSWLVVWAVLVVLLQSTFVLGSTQWCRPLDLRALPFSSLPPVTGSSSNLSKTALRSLTHSRVNLKPECTWRQLDSVIPSLPHRLSHGVVRAIGFEQPRHSFHGHRALHSRMAGCGGRRGGPDCSVGGSEKRRVPCSNACIGFLPEEILAVGNGPAPPGVVGPSTVRVVPLSVLDNGLLSPIPVRVLRFWLWISSSLWLVSSVCLLPSRLRLLPSIQTSPLEFLNRALCWLKFEIGLCQELSPAQMVTCQPSKMWRNSMVRSSSQGICRTELGRWTQPKHQGQKSQAGDVALQRVGESGVLLPKRNQQSPA